MITKKTFREIICKTLKDYRKRGYNIYYIPKYSDMYFDNNTFVSYVGDDKIRVGVRPNHTDLNHTSFGESTVKRILERFCYYDSVKRIKYE